MFCTGAYRRICQYGNCGSHTVAGSALRGHTVAMELKWIAEQLDRPGFNQAGLARALGKDPAAVNRMLKGERQIKVNELPAILGYLQAVPPGSDASGYPQPLQPLPTPDGKPDVPVWASAEAGQAGAMVLTSEPIDYIRRSERMQGVRNPSPSTSSATRWARRSSMATRWW